MERCAGAKRQGPRELASNSTVMVHDLSISVLALRAAAAPVRPLPGTCFSVIDRMLMPVA